MKDEVTKELAKTLYQGAISPDDQISKKQMNVLKEFFKLKVGEGKTFLAKALLEYDHSDGVSRRRKYQMVEGRLKEAM